MDQDSVLKMKRNRWHESLSKDVYMEEALNVLNDLKMTYGIKTKVAAVKDLIIYMTKTKNSLTGLALQKFKKSFWGVFSFWFIVLVGFVSVFAYAIAPVRFAICKSDAFVYPFKASRF